VCPATHGAIKPAVGALTGIITKLCKDLPMTMQAEMQHLEESTMKQWASDDDEYSFSSYFEGGQSEVSYKLHEETSCVAGFLIWELTAGVLHISELHVRWRRIRIGTELLESTASLAKAKSVELEVHRDNDVARCFYEARGFAYAQQPASSMMLRMYRSTDR
jgi:ribosomal protein S18 acetylase RimI-like enzyme